MAEEIGSKLTDMMASSVTVTPVTKDGRGDEVDGSPVVIACYIEGSTQWVRDSGGNYVKSTVLVITDQIHSEINESSRFTLPADYSHRTRLRPIAVDTVNDDNGPHHQEIRFP